MNKRSNEPALPPPAEPARYATNAEARESAQRMMKKHAKSLEQLADGDMSQPAAEPAPKVVMLENDNSNSIVFRAVDHGAPTVTTTPFDPTCHTVPLDQTRYAPAAEPAEPQTEKVDTEDLCKRLCSVVLHEQIRDNLLPFGMLEEVTRWLKQPSDLALLRQQVETLTQENERLKADMAKTVCSYCGHVTVFASSEERFSEVGRARLLDHILECQERPESKLLDRVLAAEAERNTLKAEQDARPCPHCYLPAVLPKVCTQEVHAAMARDLARLEEVYGNGFEAGQRAAQEAAQTRIAALREQIGKLNHHGLMQAAEVLQVIDDAQT